MAVAQVPPRGAATRSRLLDAARDLVVEVGWGSVSTRMVARRAGVPTGSVHYHFGSVDELLRAATAEALAAVAEQVRTGLATGALDDGIERLGEQVTAAAADDASQVLFGEVLLQATRDERIRSDVARLLGELRGEVARWLVRHGRAEDAVATATVLVAAVDALGMHRSLDPRLPLDGVTAVLRRTVRGASA